MYVIVGPVATNAWPLQRSASSTCPDAKTFARAIIDRIGCNRRRLMPYVNHTIFDWCCGALGLDVQEMVVGFIIKTVLMMDGKEI